jgi:hypothetical protein
MYYINPFALLWHLCSTNNALYDMITRFASTGLKTLRIVIYIDEINCGNPLAPEPAKLLEAIYWTFLDLPEWFIRRKDSWFCFTLLKSKIVHDLLGDVSELMVFVLNCFFPEFGDSFQRGITLVNGSRSRVVMAEFAGFLADEKGLKEVFGIKGQAGSVPCPLSCFNIRNRWVKLNATLQHFWDPDISRRMPTTHAHVLEMTRRLENASKKERENWSTNHFGINYVPTGIMFNRYLMCKVLRPCDHYIRDWMHTFVSGGVAGTHLALLCNALATCG